MAKFGHADVAKVVSALRREHAREDDSDEIAQLPVSAGLLHAMISVGDTAALRQAFGEKISEKELSAEIARLWKMAENLRMQESTILQGDRGERERVRRMIEFVEQYASDLNHVRTMLPTKKA